MNIIDWLGFILGIHNERLLDWAAVAIYGRLPNTILELIFAQAGQIFFAGFLGIILSALLLKLTSGNYLLKGWIYGVIGWFTLYSISIAVRLPNLETHTLSTVVAHLISASVYGLILAYTLNRIDKANLKTH